METHTIRFEDASRGTVQQCSSAEVPATIAFVDGVPVVRVVAQMRGEDREICSYGANGALLSTTMQRRA